MKKNNQLMQSPGTAPVSIYKSEALESIDKSISELAAVIQTMISQINPSEIKCETVNDVFKLSNALASLSRAKVEKERLVCEATQMLDAASKELYREIQKITTFNPRLAGEIAEVVVAARTNVKLLAD